MGQYFTAAITTTSETPSSVTLKLQIWYNSTTGVTDPSNSFAVTGDWPNYSASLSISIPFGGGSQLVYNSDLVVAKTYGATQSKSWASSLSGVDYWGGTITLSGGASVVARPYSAPAAVTAVSASRTSDTQHVVSWTSSSTGDMTTAAPYASQNVVRFDNVAATAVTIASGLSGSATSYTDSTTVANRLYQYYVVAVNSAGSTASESSPATQTTPAGPTTASAAKVGADILVTFTEGQSSGMVVTFEVYDKPNGGAAVLLATIASGLGTYTHVAPNAAQTHAYDIRAKSTVGATTYSTYATSNTIYATPAAPTGVSTSRTSDTQQVTSWTTNATAAAPYDSQQVQRKDNVNTSPVTVVTGLSGAATSYTDTTTIANRRYEYLVVAVNSSGSTTSAWAAATQTTPAGPSSAVATKSGSNVVVTFTEGQSSGMVVTFEVYDKPNGGAAVLLATIASGLGTYTHVAPNAAQTHAYDIRAKSVVGATLYSTYATSNTVQLQAPPNAPTGLLATPSVLPTGDTTRLSYAHNPVDASAQTGQQFRHRLQGAGVWTTRTAVATANQYLDLIPSAWGYTNGQSFEWAVATKGADPTYSPFSATSVVALSALPTATISAPGATYTTSSLAFAFAYYQAQGSAQAEWAAQLKLAGVVAQSMSGSGVTASGIFPAPVADATSCVLEVRVKSAAGLWSAWASQAFSVAYLPPVQITIAATYAAMSGAMQLVLTPNGVVGGVTVAAVKASVQRRIDAGAWVTIAENLNPAATLVDPIPDTSGLNEYRAVSTSATPSSATGPVTTNTPDDRRWLYVNYGPGFGSVVKCYANLSLSDASSLAQVMNHYENRAKGVASWGKAQSRTAGVAATLTDEDSPLDDWRALSWWAGPVFARDPRGQRVHAHMPGGVAVNQENQIIAKISFTVEEIDD